MCKHKFDLKKCVDEIANNLITLKCDTLDGMQIEV